MKMYCVSEATDEVKKINWADNHAICLYSGPDRALAIKLASDLGEVSNVPPQTAYPELYSSLKMHVKRVVVRYYRNAEVWYTIEEFETEETN